MLPIRVMRGDGSPLAPLAWRTEAAGERAQGWLGRGGAGPGEGLLIAPCAALHALGMQFEFDAVFMDRQGRILKVAAGIKPGRLAFAPFWSLLRPWSCEVLELPAGAAEGLRPGQRLIIEERSA